jgi:hypothetical protein
MLKDRESNYKLTNIYPDSLIDERKSKHLPYMQYNKIPESAGSGPVASLTPLYFNELEDSKKTI